MDGDQSGELDTFEDDDVDDRIEDREVSGGGDAQSHIGEALEGTPHAEDSGHEANGHQQIDIAGLHRDQIACDQDGANGQQNLTGRKAEFKTEEDREDQGHADKGGICRHLDILFEPAPHTGHLGRYGEEYPRIELENQRKEERQPHADRQGHRLFEIGDAWTSCKKVPKHAVTILPNTRHSFRHAVASNFPGCSGR